MNIILLLLLVLISMAMGFWICAKMAMNMSPQLELKVKRILQPKQNWGMIRVLRPGLQFTQDIVAMDNPGVHIKTRNEAYNLKTKYVFTEEGYPVAYFTQESTDAVPVFKNAWEDKDLVIPPSDLSLGMYNAEQEGWLDFQNLNNKIVLFIGLVALLVAIDIVLGWMQGGAINDISSKLMNTTNIVSNLTTSVNRSIFIPVGN